MIAHRLAAMVGVTVLLAPPQMLLRGRSRGAAALPHLFMRSMATLLHIEVVTHGAPSEEAGTLFVSNHLSWADVPVIGARVKGSFVAKSEVQDWPVFGWLAGLGRTVYVERERRRSAGEQSDAIAARLRAGDSVVLFPEGTTSDGVTLIPFRSALFASVEAAGDVIVQPVSLAYTRVGGVPVTRRLLPHIAWTGEAELVPHAAGFLRLGPVRAELLFHPPVRRNDFPDRKALARHCEQAVVRGYQDLMRGRVAA